MTRRGTAARRCPVCRLQRGLCICAEFTPLTTRTQVSLLMHVSELTLTSNTATLARRALSNSTLDVLGQRDQRLTVRLLPDHVPLYLFPDADARVLTPDWAASLGKPVQLIVPDGSWSQTRSVKRREPALQGLPSVTLPPGGPSQYRLRRAPRQDGLCTFEAVIEALALLEDPALRQSLGRVLELFVARTLRARSGDHRPLTVQSPD